MLIKQETGLPQVWKITPEVNTDFRGDYVMIHNTDLYELPDIKWVEWDIATSKKNVLRGIHYSPNCWKIYTCLQGLIYYVFVNCDEQDPNFCKWKSFYLKPYEQLLKHPRYGAGMLALEDNTILHYAQSQFYNADDPDQKTFKWNHWNDIWWPVNNPILSKRDQQGEYEFRLKG